MNKKKILALILAVAMVFSATAFLTALAEEEGTEPEGGSGPISESEAEGMIKDYHESEKVTDSSGNEKDNEYYYKDGFYDNGDDDYRKVVEIIIGDEVLRREKGSNEEAETEEAETGEDDGAEDEIKEEEPSPLPASPEPRALSASVEEEEEDDSITGEQFKETYKQEFDGLIKNSGLWNRLKIGYLELAKTNGSVTFNAKEDGNDVTVTVDVKYTPGSDGTWEKETTYTKETTVVTEKFLDELGEWVDDPDLAEWILTNVVRDDIAGSVVTESTRITTREVYDGEFVRTVLVTETVTTITLTKVESLQIREEWQAEKDAYDAASNLVNGTSTPEGYTLSDKEVSKDDVSYALYYIGQGNKLPEFDTKGSFRQGESQDVGNGVIITMSSGGNGNKAEPTTIEVPPGLTGFLQVGYHQNNGGTQLIIIDLSKPGFFDLGLNFNQIDGYSFVDEPGCKYEFLKEFRLDESSREANSWVEEDVITVRYTIETVETIAPPPPPPPPVPSPSPTPGPGPGPGGDIGETGGGDEGGVAEVVFLGAAGAADVEEEGDVIAPAATTTIAAAPADIPLAQVNDGGPDIIEAGDIIAPLVEIGAGSSWHLWNLILSLAGVALAIAMGIRAIGNKKKEDEQIDEDPQNRKKSLVLGLAIPVTAVVACVLFILTQDMTLPMAMVDQWTLAHAGLFGAGLASFIFADRKVKDDEAEATA